MILNSLFAYFYASPADNTDIDNSGSGSGSGYGPEDSDNHPHFNPNGSPTDDIYFSSSTTRFPPWTVDEEISGGRSKTKPKSPKPNQPATAKDAAVRTYSSSSSLLFGTLLMLTCSVLYIRQSRL